MVADEAMALGGECAATSSGRRPEGAREGVKGIGEDGDRALDFWAAEPVRQTT